MLTSSPVQQRRGAEVPLDAEEGEDDGVDCPLLL